jgi:hypothetical protein
LCPAGTFAAAVISAVYPVAADFNAMTAQGRTVGVEAHRGCAEGRVSNLTKTAGALDELRHKGLADRP